MNTTCVSSPLIEELLNVPIYFNTRAENNRSVDPAFGSQFANDFMIVQRKETLK